MDWRAWRIANARKPHRQSIACGDSGPNPCARQWPQQASVKRAFRSARQYDADGNLVDDGRYQYVWDAANRLVGIMDSSTGTVTSFDYDGLGRRLVIGQSDTSGNHAETRYLWCGGELCGTRDVNGRILAGYAR